MTEQVSKQSVTCWLFFVVFCAQSTSIPGYTRARTETGLMPEVWRSSAPGTASTTRTSLHWTAAGMRKTPGQTENWLGAEISRKTQNEPLKVSANCLELCCSFSLIAVYPPPFFCFVLFLSSQPDEDFNDF